MRYSNRPDWGNAIHNTVLADCDGAYVTPGDSLDFWHDGKLYRIPLRHSRTTPLLKRLCPSWMSVWHVVR